MHRHSWPLKSFSPGTPWGPERPDNGFHPAPMATQPAMPMPAWPPHPLECPVLKTSLLLLSEKGTSDVHGAGWLWRTPDSPRQVSRAGRPTQQSNSQDLTHVPRAPPKWSSPHCQTMTAPTSEAWKCPPDRTGPASPREGSPGQRCGLTSSGLHWRQAMRAAHPSPWEAHRSPWGLGHPGQWAKAWRWVLAPSLPGSQQQLLQIVLEPEALGLEGLRCEVRGHAPEQRPQLWPSCQLTAHLRLRPQSHSGPWFLFTQTQNGCGLNVSMKWYSHFIVAIPSQKVP